MTVPGVNLSATVVCAVAPAADELVMAEALLVAWGPGYGSLQYRARWSRLPHWYHALALPSLSPPCPLLPRPWACPLPPLGPPVVVVNARAS